jgi:hypothetical protein
VTSHRHPRRVTSDVVRFAVGFLLVALALAHWNTRASAADDPGDDTVPAVDIEGTGSWAVNSLFTLLSQAETTSSQSWTAGYVAKGDRDGRRAFATGEKDFVVAGTPLTDDDRAALSLRGVGEIDAPFAVSSIAFVLGGLNTAGTDGAFLQTCVPKLPRGLTCSPYAGDPPGVLTMDDDQISQLFLVNGFNVWITDAMQAHLPSNINPPGKDLVPVVRSDASALNYYFEQFIDRTNHDLYRSQLTNAGLDPALADQPSEDWYLLLDPSRGGGDSVATAVTAGQTAADASIPMGGQIAPVAASDITALHDSQDNLAEGRLRTQLFTVAVQNGTGTPVVPTSANLSKAALLGGGKPLFGLDPADIPAGQADDYRDVYPLTYIDRIYVPASGLPVDKTNALATLIRVEATVGQSLQVTRGEGQLPPTLVSEAMTKADQVVAANCVGGGRHVVTVADGGPYWPQPATSAPAHVTLCADASGSTAPPPTTTTEAPAPATATGSPAGGGLAPSAGTTPLEATGPTAVTPANTGGAPATTGAAAPATTGSEQHRAFPVVARLPMDLPDDGDRTGLSRLDALLLGAGLFLVCRRPARRLLARWR